MKKIIYTSIFFTVIFTPMLIAGAQKMNNNNQIDYSKPYSVSEVSEIIDGKTIRIKGGKIVSLKDVENIDPKYTTALLQNNKVIVIALDDQVPQSAYVYIWGVNADSIPSYIPKEKLQYVGFLNVKEHPLGSPKKGRAVFLNKTLKQLL